MKYYNIVDFGAKADTLSTAAIQAAVDKCAADGGGTVVIENGTYISGTIFLKSNVHLRIEAGAKLFMSGNITDFPDFSCEWDVREAPRRSARCLIYIGNCENVSIEGMGTIDCNGSAYCEEDPEPLYKDDDPFHHMRMKRKLDLWDSIGRMIFVMKSKNVTLEDFTLTEMAGGWGIWVNCSQLVNIRGLKVNCCPHYPNSDGFHINCSKDVFITDCAVHTGDDAVTLRANTNTLGADIPCENIVVKGCTLSSNCQAIRIGWFGDGVIRNCVFSDLVITDSRDAITMLLPGWGSRGDTGRNTTRIERLSFNNILMDRVWGRPVKITIADSEDTKCEYIRNIRFNQLIGTTKYFPLLMGRKSNYLEDISFTNCRLEITEKAETGLVARFVKNLAVDCTWNVD